MTKLIAKTRRGRSRPAGPTASRAPRRGSAARGSGRAGRPGSSRGPRGSRARPPCARGCAGGGELAHEGRGDGRLGAQADAHDEAQDDEHADADRQGRGAGGDAVDEQDEGEDGAPAEPVGEQAPDRDADHHADEADRADPAEPAVRQAPLGGEGRHDVAMRRPTSIASSAQPTPEPTSSLACSGAKRRRSSLPPWWAGGRRSWPAPRRLGPGRRGRQAFDTETITSAGHPEPASQGRLGVSAARVDR